MSAPNYLRPNSRLTVREAVEELRVEEGPDKDASGSMAELAEDLDIHDVIHVIFGCPTTLAGEVLAHVWTVFGTTARLRDLHRVTSHRDHRRALAGIGHARLFRCWLRSVPHVALAAVRAAQMNRRLPVAHLASLLDQPLADVRREFGIRLVPVSSSLAERNQPPTGALVRRLSAAGGRQKSQ